MSFSPTPPALLREPAPRTGRNGGRRRAPRPLPPSGRLSFVIELDPADFHATHAAPSTFAKLGERFDRLFRNPDSELARAELAASDIAVIGVAPAPAPAHAT